MAKPKPAREPKPRRKVRPCLLCRDTGMIRVWRRDEDGRRYSVDEACACKSWRFR